MEPDGAFLATGSADGSIKIWGGPKYEKLFSIDGHTEAVTSVAWSPDGTRIAVPSQDRTVQVYAVGVNALLALAKRRVTRHLTQEECQSYLHWTTCPDVH